MEQDFQLYLTRRQRQIAEHLRVGLSVKMTAEKLGIKPKTAVNMVAKMHSKFNVHSNAALIHLLIKKDLI